MLSWDREMLHTRAMRGEILSELQKHANRHREFSFNSKAMVKNQHRVTKVTDPCQRAVCFFMGMNLK